jgi:hypothetical protein
MNVRCASHERTPPRLDRRRSAGPARWTPKRLAAALGGSATGAHPAAPLALSLEWRFLLDYIET